MGLRGGYVVRYIYLVNGMLIEFCMVVYMDGLCCGIHKRFAW